MLQGLIDGQHDPTALADLAKRRLRAKMNWLVAHSLEVKPKTFAGYRFLVDRYVVPRVGRMKLQAVSPMHLSSLYRELLDGGGRNGRPLSRRTIDAVHRVLRKAFNDAVISDQLLESNPVVRAKRPKGSAGEVGLIWTPAELGRFLDHANSHRLYAFFHVAAFTGARRGELLTLCWTDLDLVAGVVTIRAPRPLSSVSGSWAPLRAAGSGA
jgi:integrase